MDRPTGNHPKRPGIVSRLLLAIAGVDTERLRHCPPGDRLFAWRIAVQLIVSLLFVGMTCFLALQVGFDRKPGSTPVIAVAATLVALVIFLLDSAIIQSDWFQHGQTIAASHGLESNGSPSRWRRPMTVALRLVLSTAIAFAFASFIELRMFSDDIAKEIDRTYKASNAVIFADVSNEIDGRERETLAAITQVDVRIKDLQAQADRTRLAAPEVSDLDAEIKALIASIQQLTNRRSQLNIEIAQRTDDQIAELNGTKVDGRGTGHAGRGPYFETAKEMAKIRESEVGRLTQEIAAAEARLAALRDQRQRVAGAADAARQIERRNIDETVLALRAQRHALDQRLAAVRQERDHIQDTARSRAGYVEKPEGFLAQVAALDRIKKAAAAWWLAFWMKLVILLIEVAPVVTKVLFGMSTLYSLRTATDFRRAASDEIAALREHELEQEKVRLNLEKEVEDERVVMFDRRGDALRKADIHRKFYKNEDPEGRR